MSTNAVRETESITVSQKFTDLISRYKLTLSVIAILIIASIIGLGSYIAITDSIAHKAYAVLEEAEESLEKAKSNSDQAAITASEDEVLESLQKYVKKGNKAFVRTRAFMLIADISFSRKDWATAQTSYMNAYLASPKAYTAGLNAYNAAVCADEAGKTDEAIELFTKALSTPGYTQNSRTKFNIARLEEQRGNAAAALEMYKSLIADSPDDEWALLAQSRIIALEK